MKRKASIVFLLLCGVSAALPQGTVNFSNRDLNPSPAVLVYLGNPFAGGVPLVGTNWVAQLYYGAPGSPESSLIPVNSPPAAFDFPTTSFPVDAIRIDLSSATVPEYNEIDAVSIQ